MKSVDAAGLADVPGLVRVEDYDRDAIGERIVDLTHAVYPHDQQYGEYCTIQGWIDCPPEKVFAYMADPYSLCEWTYSVRELRPAGKPGLYVGVDSGRTPIYCKTVASREAMTVDYHCAWDQGDELWMIYLNRIVPAELVLDKPGTVVVWTNCHHPYYDRNPFPELAGSPDRTWVGEWWPLFFGGHTLEFRNLKAILEHRHARGLPMGPHVVAA